MPDEPTYLLELAIESKSRAGHEKMIRALESMVREDSSFSFSTDPESGQTIVRGNSEEILGAKIEALKQVLAPDMSDGSANIVHLRGDFSADLCVGAPQVAYRETLSKPFSIRYTHKKHLGPMSQFAEVTIDFKPLPPGSGFVFENAVTNGAVPAEYIPAVEKGLKAQKESGLLAGFPVIDFQATLTDGKYHEMDSNPLAFDIAARAAFRELASKSGVKLLEPIMKIEVATPDDFTGVVIGDLLRRRAAVEGQDTHDNDNIIYAIVPLANMFSYANALHAMTQGRAQYTMQFGHYAVVPPDIAGGDDPKFPGAMGVR